MRIYPPNAQIQNKPKIYIACCKDNEELFKRVCEMILSVRADAVMFCRETEDEDDSLNHMNIFVFPVSQDKFNSDPYINREINLANQNGIPVLPLILQGLNRTLFEQYFGKMQSLNIFEKDATELPFKDKLKLFLDSVLADSSLRQRISDSVRARVFLSYRKKDREYALKIMKAVHADERLRDVAIWFDEFLVPGEEYNLAIKNELENSDIVMLLVTPSVLEDGNYVMVHEYPDSVNNGKKIIPVEAVETDKTDLQSKFINLPKLVQLDEQSISEAILSSGLPDDVNNTEKCEKDYCIGMAFLNGILAEKNSGYALEHLSKAADEGSEDAYKQLVAYYRYGNRRTKDLDKANNWQFKYYGHLVNINRNKVEPDYKCLSEEIFVMVRLFIDQYVELRGRPVLTSANNQPVESNVEDVLEKMLDTTKGWLNGGYQNIALCRKTDPEYYSRKLIEYYNLLFEVSEYDGASNKTRIEILDKGCDCIENYCQTYGYEVDMAANYGENLYKKGQLSLVDYNEEDFDDPGKCRERLQRAAGYFEESHRFFDTLMSLDDSIGLKRSAGRTVYSLASAWHNLGEDDGMLLEYANKAVDILEIICVQTGDFEDMADLANAYDLRSKLKEGRAGIADLKKAVELMEKAWRGNGRMFYQMLYLQMKNRLDRMLDEE